MAFVNLLPRTAYKRLENWARKLRFFVEPVKKITGGRALFPWAVIIHMTYRCNLDCFMCCQHIADYSDILPAFPEPHEELQELSLQEWKRVIDDLAASFPILPFLHFSGGEPFLYGGFTDLVAYARGKGFSVSIITNGWFLESVAEALVDLGLNRLHVSVDGPEKIHDAIRRREGSYKRAIEGIRKVIQVRNEKGKKFPHVTLNCTISRENADQLEEMIDVTEMAGADHLTYQHTVFFDNEREMVEGIDTDRLYRTLKNLEKRHKNVTVYAHIPKKRWETYYKGSSNDLGRGCGWNWVGLRLHPNGEVVPCRGIVVGSVADGRQSLKEIWNAPAYREMRRELAKIGNAEECGRCTHRMF